MQLRLSVVLGPVALALIAAPVAGASASTSDPLGCVATVFDPADHVDDVAIEPQVVAFERSLDADVHVRIETAIDGDLDARIDQLVAQCAGWSDGAGELDEDLIVVMFSPVERESAVFYGADHADVLEGEWESVVDAMTSDLRAGDYDDAVEAALLRLDALSSSTSSSSSSRDADQRGGEFPVGWLLVVAAIVVVSWLYRWYNGGDSGADDDADADESTSSWFGGSTSRRRSFRSSSSSSGRRSGGGGGRSSSRGNSGRAGGGSKKW